MSIKIFYRIGSLTLILVLLITGCAPSAEEPAEEVVSETPAEPAVETLKVALLPVVDTLPFYIAEANGYFTEEGVAVEAVPVASPVDRDQLMQAGEIDGMLTELTTVGIFNREAVQVQIISYARVAAADGPVFRLLAAPRSNITIPSDLAGNPIGVSQNTVIEYVTERLLQESGLTDDQIVTESVPVIPERFQLLMSGDLLAATLPDPLAQAAIEAGAILIIDDSAFPAYSSSSLAFSVDAIQNKTAAVQAFLTAWNRAVADLNADPESYRSLFLEKVAVPESVQATYLIRPFPFNEVPSQAEWDDVMAWLIDKGLIDAPSAYADSVITDFID